MIKMDKRILLIMGFIFIGLLYINAISAQTGGCCVSSTTGMCSENADSSACGDGIFLNAGCSGVSQCGEGCCLLGTSSQYVTSGTCEVLSASYGFAYPSNFQVISREACYSQN